MAWRALGRKQGVSTSLTKALEAAVRASAASVSKCGIHDSAKSLPTLVRHLQGQHHTAAFLSTEKGLPSLVDRCSIRCFHASPELLARKREDHSLGLKTSKRVKVVNSGKFSKRKKETQPPVEAPYVPPRLSRTTKSLANKTIEIFEGMTIVELAKRCGESIATIQNIITNVGEKVDSEFDPLSIDIAELTAMVNDTEH